MRYVGITLVVKVFEPKKDIESHNSKFKKDAPSVEQRENGNEIEIKKNDKTRRC